MNTQTHRKPAKPILSAFPAAHSVVQQQNLRYLESALREQWKLGQNILLCCTAADDGIQLLRAPHYFLGKFSASLNNCSPTDRLDALNGRFIREMISGGRQLPLDEFEGAARRLELPPRHICLPVELNRDRAVMDAVDVMLRRYSISHVKSRAVLLFDVVNFSLVTPFEQTSQLNSLSYSLNAAYNKLLKRGVEVNFSHTTTGDGYYVWNEESSH